MSARLANAMNAASREDLAALVDCRRAQVEAARQRAGQILAMIGPCSPESLIVAAIESSLGLNLRDFVFRAKVAEIDRLNDEVAAAFQRWETAVKRKQRRVAEHHLRDLERASKERHSLHQRFMDLWDEHDRGLEAQHA